MGISVKPSFKRHHGYRTRERPPTRQAHRSDGLTARARARCRRRRSLPNKKPAAVCAAGFLLGLHCFPRGMRCRRPPFAVAGGGACDAVADRVVFRHSLLLGNDFWAKPNHGFFNCQQPARNFFRDAFGRRASRSRASHRARRYIAHQDARDATRVFAASKQWRGLQRFLQREGENRRGENIATTLRTQAGDRLRNAGGTTMRAAMPLRVAQARLRESARTFLRRHPWRHAFRSTLRVAENAPGVFRASDSGTWRRRFPHARKEEPAALPPRVPMHDAGRERRQWSSSSSSSA